MCISLNATKEGTDMVSTKRLTPLHAAACFISALTVCATASAQYTGPVRKSGQTGVSSILKNPVDDQYVSLKGHITARISHDKYVLTGKDRFREPEIDVKHLRIVSP